MYHKPPEKPLVENLLLNLLFIIFKNINVDNKHLLKSILYFIHEKKILSKKSIMFAFANLVKTQNYQGCKITSNFFGLVMKGLKM